MEKNEVEEGTLIVGRKDLTAAAQNLPAAEINRTHLPLTKEISQALRIVFREGEFEAVIKEPAEKQEVPAPDENENPAGGFYDKVSESVDVKRSITTHRCGEGMDETVEVAVFDEPGNGGACHKYGVGVMNASGQMDGILISFQNGPIEEAGPNGISCEALLAIVKDRLECFQAGSFACEANGHALDAVDGALHALHSRTLGRRAAGTEGTSDPAPVETEPASEELKMFMNYRKRNLQPMRPYILDENLEGVSVSDEDTPAVGGMVAVNPSNPSDQWYVAQAFFEENYELAGPSDIPLPVAPPTE